MKRLVVGVTGASGLPLAARLLQTLKTVPDWESHLIVTAGALRTLQTESVMAAEDFLSLGDVCYSPDDIGAAIASGSFSTEGMLIVPCSMKTLAGISGGYADNLVLRAADVTLKERRRLVLAVRETPLSRIHLQNMLAVTGAGAIVMPPVLTYYHGPDPLADMERHLVSRMLGAFGISCPEAHSWKGGAR